MVIKNDLTGKKINRLLVLEPVPRNLYSRTKYKCLCDCGKEIIVEGSKIKNGHTKSCGCYRETVDYGSGARKPKGEANKNSLISSYKSNAKRKGYEFTLTDEEITNLFQSECFYCGSEPKNIYNRPKSNGHYVYNGIDRKDNDIGYTLDNVVSCCSQCNYIKNSFNYDDFISWIDKAHTNLKNKQII
jgi:hypothetical protein